MRFESKRDVWIVLVLRVVPLVVSVMIAGAWYAKHGDVRGPLIGAALLIFLEIFFLESRPALDLLRHRRRHAHDPQLVHHLACAHRRDPQDLTDARAPCHRRRSPSTGCASSTAVG
jgi:hypothetical protein